MTFVVDTREKAYQLLRILRSTPHPVAVDCETDGVDPTTEAPIQKGQIVLWSVAWVDERLGLHPEHKTPLSSSAVIYNWGEYRHLFSIFVDWLRSDAPKVGANWFGFDHHLFEHGGGLSVGGAIWDVVGASRQLHNSNKLSHSLKASAQRVLGYEMSKFDDLFKRPKRGKPLVVKQTRTIFKKASPRLLSLGYPPRYWYTSTAGEYDTWNKSTEYIPLLEFVELYQHRMDDLVHYAGLDAKVTLDLYFVQSNWAQRVKARTSSLRQVLVDTWFPACQAVGFMESRGVLIDRELLQGQSKALTGEREECRQRFEALSGGVNPDSPLKLQEWLYDFNGYTIPAKRGSKEDAARPTRDDERPTDRVALQQIKGWLEAGGRQERADTLGALLEYKAVTKTLQYADAIQAGLRQSGRIHCQFSATTQTGRLACKKPNLQQIPKGELRDVFIASPGHKLIVADYSGLEMAIMAHMCLKMFKDSSLWDDFQTADVHGTACKRVWPHLLNGIEAGEIKNHPDKDIRKLRTFVKAVSYGILYGKSAYGLAFSLDISPDEAQEVIQLYFEAYPGIQKFQDWAKAFAQKNLYIPTLFGRRRPLPEINSGYSRARREATRQAYNTPIQGTAADIVMAAMNKTNTEPDTRMKALGHYNEKLAKLKCNVLLQVHDELVAEVPEENAEEAKAELVYAMENPLPEGWLEIQLAVDAHICNTWGEAK